MAQDSKLLNHAARMRHEATPFEIVLWRHLCRSQLGGHKFRRQHVVGSRIVDFFCPAKGVAVEVDGDTHRPDERERRDAELLGHGIKAVHFSNWEIAHNLEAVLESLYELLSAMPDRWPHPNPSPEGEGLESGSC